MSRDSLDNYSHVAPTNKKLCPFDPFRPISILILLWNYLTCWHEPARVLKQKMHHKKCRRSELGLDGSERIGLL